MGHREERQGLLVPPQMAVCRTFPAGDVRVCRIIGMSQTHKSIVLQHMIFKGNINQGWSEIKRKL